LSPLANQIECISRRDVADGLISIEVELAVLGLVLGVKMPRLVFPVIRITMPTNIEITGMSASISSSAGLRVASVSAVS
jgi:hypothetical protein